MTPPAPPRLSVSSAYTLLAALPHMDRMEFAFRAASPAMAHLWAHLYEQSIRDFVAAVEAAIDEDCPDLGLSVEIDCARVVLSGPREIVREVVQGVARAVADHSGTPTEVVERLARDLVEGEEDP